MRYSPREPNGRDREGIAVRNHQEEAPALVWLRTPVGPDEPLNLEAAEHGQGEVRKAIEPFHSETSAPRPCLQLHQLGKIVALAFVAGVVRCQRTLDDLFRGKTPLVHVHVVHESPPVLVPGGNEVQRSGPMQL
jgi:hypothetical protein